MHRICPPLLAFLVFLSPLAVDAKTYKCEAVDTVAKLGISPRSTVSVSGDESKKSCKFSVDGAAVSSFLEESLLSGNWSSDQLAAMILSADPDSDIDLMSEILENSRGTIQQCVRHLVTGDGEFKESINHSWADGFCIVTESQSVEFGSITLLSDRYSVPILLLFIQRDRLTNLLAIPKPQTMHE